MIQNIGIQNLSNLFQSKPVLLELLCILVFGSIIFWGVEPTSRMSLSTSTFPSGFATL